MKPADLDRIEIALQIKLPPAYRRTMEAYPFTPGSFGIQMLVDDPELLLRWNAREKKVLEDEAADPSIGKELFQIGSDCSELSFFIRLVGPAHAILCYDVESGKLSEYAKDLAEYVARCARVDRDEESLPNEHHDFPESRKWLVSFGLLTLLILFGYGVFKLICWLLR